MPTSTEAEEHLRVIRSLMEKATIYRAISSPAAALGGILSISASFAFGNWWSASLSTPTAPERVIETSHFLTLWLAVLTVTALANLYFLWSAAKERRDFFVSPGMKAAAKALLPNYLVAAVLTCLVIQGPRPSFVVPVWIVCHGLGLLATAHFAPRSLVRLGWAFLVAGLISFGWFDPAWSRLPIGTTGQAGPDWLHNRALLIAQGWMAVTFGFFHVIYAACTWPRKAKGEP